MSRIDQPTLLAMIESGRTSPPRALALPAEKQGFPKVLCLDTNAWIRLGQAHYRHPDGERFQPILAAVRDAVRHGRLVVPMSVTGMFEARGARRIDRRERLARFMVDLSGNFSMPLHVVTEPPEIRNAIRRQYLCNGESEVVRTSLLHWGVGAISGGSDSGFRLTGDPARDSQMRATYSSPEGSVQAILAMLDNSAFAAMRARESNTMRQVAEVRALDAQLTPEERLRRELGNWLLMEAPLLSAALASLGVRNSEFLTWLARGDNLQRFCLDVPSTDVLATLMLTRDRNPQAVTHENDGLDWKFFQVAIPYGNIVVTENSWAHYANETGLAARYETRVVGLADAAELPRLLEAEGCR